jgi:hypothetical protein
MLQQIQCVNQVEVVCQDLERTINQTAWKTLNILERDCNTLTVLIEKHLEQESEDCGISFKKWS